MVESETNDLEFVTDIYGDIRDKYQSWNLGKIFLLASRTDIPIARPPGTWE